MTLLKHLERRDPGEIGGELHAFAAELYPICRSITGQGIRETLERIGKRIPLRLTNVPTGTQVFDWTVPQEWNIRDAYIKDSAGVRIVDFQRSNLHVMNYSAPVHATMTLSELRPHLFSAPETPGWIPYRTSYYQENWGFCLPHRQLQEMQEGVYEVCIDSTLENGNLTYGECYIPGRSRDEILISAHACHPSLANDNLSGVTVATALAGLLAGRELRYSYRFLFVPATIGTIAWLAKNQQEAGRIRHGLVLTCIGDAAGFHYKKSRRGNTEIDRAVAEVLRHLGEPSEILDFSPYGYDERQYCSPGFNLPVGCLMRSVWGTFPEYHTSADNLEFIKPDKLAQSLRVCAAVLDVLEGNRKYCNLSPFCEPQLGRRNLFRGGGSGGLEDEMSARLWVLNLSDGEHSLLDIAERSGHSFALIREAAEALRQGGLLAPMQDAEPAADSDGSKTVSD
jgi:aminopeptidase-like protein